MTSETTGADYQQSTPLFTSMTNRNLLRVLVVGFLSGVAFWLFSVLLERYIFGPVLCGGGQCGSSGMASSVTSAVLVGVGSLVGLVKAQTYRPLLVIVASFAALWGLGAQMGASTPYSVALVTGVLYSFSYALFAWVLRLRLFWIAIALVVLLVVAVRYLLTV